MRVSRAWLGLAACVIGACSSPVPELPAGFVSGALQGRHEGPPVAVGNGGTGRFVLPLIEGLELEDSPALRAEDLAELEAVLRERGFGADGSLRMGWTDVESGRVLAVEVRGRRRTGRGDALVVCPTAGSDARARARAIAEGMRALVRALRQRRLTTPGGTLRVLFGEPGPLREAIQASKGHEPAAAVLLEAPAADDTASLTLVLEWEPPLHVEREPARPSPRRRAGVAVLARAAAIDVSQAARPDWTSTERAFRTDPLREVLLDLDVPTVGFAVSDAGRSAGHAHLAGAVAALCTALGVADARPADLARHLDGLNLERRARLAELREESGPDAPAPSLPASWESWSVRRRMWLRELCLDLDGATGRAPVVEPL